MSLLSGNISSSKQKKSTKNSKFTSAKSFWLDPISGSKSAISDEQHTEHWDSGLEHSVYTYLVAVFGKDAIVRQYKLKIKPATKTFNQRDWKVDFYLNFVDSLDRNRCVPIEVKGGWIFKRGAELAKFRMQLELLEAFNPLAYGELLILGSKEAVIHKPIKILEYKSAIEALRKE